MKQHTTFALFALLPFFATAQRIENVHFYPDGNNVDIYYDIADAQAGQTFDISVEFTENKGRSWDPIGKTSGAVGKGITAGTGKRITWQLIEEYGAEGLSSPYAAFKVKAVVQEANTPPAGDMVLITGGSFSMGSKSGESDETHVRTVTVSSFYMSKYETTVGDFKKFIDATAYQTIADKEGSSYVYNGSSWDLAKGVNWKCDAEGKLRSTADYNHPVLHVSWYDAIEYCNWRSRQEGLAACYAIDKNKKDANNQNSSDNYRWTVTCSWSANGYRLPTEAEWEYAAGSGSKHYTYSWGNAEPSGKYGGNVADMTAKEKFSGWTVAENYKDGYIYTAPVGSFAPNDFGLYDMSGNVWEWCWDWYGSDYYGKNKNTNPQGADSGSYRVLRGGSWNRIPANSRVAYRDINDPYNRSTIRGFRLVRPAVH